MPQHRHLAEGLALAALVVAPLALGAVHPPVVVAISALGVLSLLVLASGTTMLRAGGLAAVLMAVCAAMLAQLVPLPPELAARLAPNAHALYVQAGVRGWHALSLDPAGTALELCKGLGFLSVLLVLQHRAAESAKARDRALRAIAGAGVAVALIGLAHFARGERRALLGLYELAADKPFLTTFGNPNHAAGFLAAGALTSLGLAAGAARLLPRLGWGAAFLACAAGVILTASRGGAMALAAGLVLLPAIGAGARRRTAEGEASWRSWATVGVAALAAALVAWGIYAALPRLLGELATAFALDLDAERGKVEGWRIAWNAARANPIAGIGRGAFASVQALYVSQPWRVSFTHAENEAMQALAELGFGAGALLVLGIAGAWLALVRRGRYAWKEAGAAAAAFALLLQNLVDFSLEYAAGLALLALFAFRPARELRPPGGLARAFAFGAAGAVAVCAALALPGLDADREALARRGADRAVPLDALEAEVHAAFAARPGDWLPAEVAATRALAEAPARALPWIERMLKLAPTAGRAHLLAGEAFARLGRKSQALGEFRQAASFGEPSMEHVLRHFPDDVLSAVPIDPDAANQAAAVLMRANRLDEAAEILAGAHRRAPEHADVTAQLAALRLRRKEPEEALALARKLRALEPAETRGHALHARALRALGRPDEARAAYDEAVAKLGWKQDFVFGLAELELERRRPEEALQILERLPLGAPPWAQTQRHWLRARAFRAQRELVKARDELRLCVDRAPGNEWYRITLADVLLELRDLPAAEAALAPVIDAPAAKAARARLERAREAERERREELDRLRIGGG